MSNLYKTPSGLGFIPEGDQNGVEVTLFELHHKVML